MKLILTFDTETISLTKKFIYNLGYNIADIETGEIKCKRNFIIKQIWENKPLFATAYYSNKRPLYTKYLKGRTAKIVTWGEACRLMLKDIKDYNIQEAYAYNSAFDITAFYFNHLWYRNKRQPLNDLKVFDIMDEISVIIDTQDYKDFCRANGFVTAKNVYRKTVESVYSYLSKNPDFKEEHTALSDSLQEFEILKECRARAKALRDNS